MTGTRGGRQVTAAAAAVSPAATGSIRGEWKAWLTRSRLTLRPRADHWPATVVTACSSPAMTVADGPLTAAIPAPVTPARDCATSASDAWTENIAPPGGRACMSRLRAVTSAHASGRDSAPATCAAASSPMECPST